MRLVSRFALISFATVSLLAANRDTQPELKRPRHIIIDAEHPLQADERAELQRSGLKVIRPAGGGRYIATIEGDEASFRSTAIRSLQSIDNSKKVAPSVARVMTSNPAAVPLRVTFWPDVDFDTARVVLRASGAEMRRPLDTRFATPSTIEVLLSANRVEALAADDRVMTIHGGHRQIKEHNAKAAELSHVTELFSAPYNLSGSGVVVGVWDIGSVSAGHSEFEGRVIAEDGGSVAVTDHPTHVTGTITAHGFQPLAKGMAPSATVHQFNVTDGFLESKATNFPKFNIRVDNNSWGYVLGWDFDEALSDWVWADDVEDFGAYADPAAGVDQLIRTTGTLTMFSAGNDGNDSGPISGTFRHYHTDNSGNPDSHTVYCYSPNGSGNDCGTGCNRCETTHHPSDGPFFDMSIPGAAKNAVAVGAVMFDGPVITNFSSRGPTTDGRIKPEVVAKGFQQFSTLPNNRYGTNQGTSMSSPVITGIGALLVEQWRKTNGGANPTPETLRGLLIHGADDLGNPGPDYTYGFGLADAKNSVDTIIADNGSGSRIHTGTTAQGGVNEYSVNITQGSNARFTLVWSDPENTPYPQSGIALVNDLDLKVIDASGHEFLPYVLDKANPNNTATTGVNHVDNVEMVEVKNATAGIYKVRVTGSQIASTSPQSFVLFSRNDLSAAAPPCTDTYEPNDSQSAAWGRVPNNKTLHAALCQASDVDFYRFDVDRSGTVKVELTAGSAPIHVTLSSASTTSVSVDIAANATGSVQTTIGSGSGAPISAVTFFVQVSTPTAITSPDTYSLKATYGTSITKRTRPVRR